MWVNAVGQVLCVMFLCILPFDKANYCWKFYDGNKTLYCNPTLQFIMAVQASNWTLAMVELAGPKKIGSKAPMTNFCTFYRYDIFKTIICMFCSLLLYYC